MAALFVNITLEPGDGQGKCIERKGEIIRFVGERSSEGIFDTVTRY